MQFDPKITINGMVFDYVDTQRDGDTAIYKSESAYLRIGAPEKVKRDLALHKQMENYGFPVAKLLAEGELCGMHYFAEESLGEKHFGHIFRDETEALGKIKDETFDRFTDVCTKFAEVQLKTATQDKNWDDFRRGIHLDTINEELPEDKKRILARYERARERLSPFPFVVTHGDFGTFNICPGGVIDLQDSFMGPAGYDLGGLIESHNWFPESKDYEFYRLFNFSPEQRKRFLDRTDGIYRKNGLPKISDYLDEFNFTRGVWFAVRMDGVPKLQKFRYEVLKSLL